MKRLSRLTSISAVVACLKNGIACLTEQNDEGKIRYAYLTSNQEILAQLGIEVDQSLRSTKTTEVAYDIVRRKPMLLTLSLFTGYIHEIASLEDNASSDDNDLLALDKPCLHIETQLPAALISAIEATDYAYVFSYGSGSETKVVNVDDHGFDSQSKKQIENAERNQYGNYVRIDGYLLIDKKTDPIFLPKEKFQNDMLGKKGVLFDATATACADTMSLHGLKINYVRQLAQ